MSEMKLINDGGPAFPSVQPENLMVDQCCWGMSLRDYFAGCALKGLLPKLPLIDQQGEHGESVPDKIAHNRDIAESCYWLADAMIAARSVKHD